MAIAPVTLVESLRPWAGAGLGWLLMDAPVRLPELLAAVAPPPQARVGHAAVDSGFASVPQPQSASDVAAEQQQSSGQAASGGSARTSTTAQAARQATRQAAPQPAPQAASPALPTFASRAAVPADPQNWPEPWRTQAAKTKAASVVWTYHELGLDMAGIGEPSARGPLFRKIIAELGLPKGSSAFWPSALPNVQAGALGSAAAEASFDTPQANPALFSAGLMHLAPQVLIISGAAALTDIGLDPASLAPFRQTVIEGKLVVLVPDTAALLQDPAAVATTVSFLRAVLHSLVVNKL